MICGAFTLALISNFSSLSVAEDQLPEKVAGRTVEGWAKDLGSENEFVRARAAKALGPFGKKALDSLKVALEDKSPAVQYWPRVTTGSQSIVPTRMPAKYATRFRRCKLAWLAETPASK